MPGQVVADRHAAPVLDLLPAGTLRAGRFVVASVQALRPQCRLGNCPRMTFA